jgi:hypothetical protein
MAKSSKKRWMTEKSCLQPKPEYKGDNNFSLPFEFGETACCKAIWFGGSWQPNQTEILHSYSLTGK